MGNRTKNDTKLIKRASLTSSSLPRVELFLAQLSPFAISTVPLAVSSLFPIKIKETWIARKGGISTIYLYILEEYAAVNDRNQENEGVWPGLKLGNNSRSLKNDWGKQCISSETMASLHKYLAQCSPLVYDFKYAVVFHGIASHTHYKDPDTQRQIQGTLKKNFQKCLLNC